MNDAIDKERQRETNCLQPRNMSTGRRRESGGGGMKRFEIFCKQFPIIFFFFHDA